MSSPVPANPTTVPAVTVVAFDFDHTLTVRDSVVPFVMGVAGLPRVLGAVLRTFPRVFGLVRRRDNDGLKEHFSLHCLAGLALTDVEEAGLVHAERIVSGRMRADTCRRLREHQEAGDVVVIVTASFGSYMHVVGDLLEVDAVLCTELESVDGVLTGRLEGRNCRGAEKVRRLEQWMSESGIDAGSLRIAYGDSSGDDQMLETAVTGIRVGDEDLSSGVGTESDPG